jgi:parvulin-like peptidyl-prolyl isomerase
MSLSTNKRRGWRGVLVCTGCIAVLIAAGFGIRAALLGRGMAQTAPTPAAAPPALSVPSAPAVPTDYGSRVVAYIYETQPVPREELGEYLIDRYGAEKLELLINKRIIDTACREQGVEVTGAEVEAALAEDLQGLNMDCNGFVNNVLARYHKTLFEWKEDVLRSKLQMAKLCRSRVHVSPEEVQQAYEAAYGEKLEGQIILWPKGAAGEKQALADYGKIRDNPAEFDRLAKEQKARTDLAATAGKTKAFGRHTMGDDNFDRAVFCLKPGEISPVVLAVEGPIVFKCLRRHPADTSVSLDAVRDKLVKAIADKKVALAMQTTFDTLRKQAQPEPLLKKKNKADDPDGAPAAPGVPRSRQVVACFRGGALEPITREELGEFLITRYGAEKLEYLINRRIVAKECAAHGITVTTAEVEVGLADDIKKLNTTEKEFEKDFLRPYHKNLYEWREDVVRPRLALSRLVRDRVRISEDEVKMAFDAHFGEKLDCRMILWPPDQTRFALAEYAQIRDNPKAFEEKAKRQASSSLAAHGGRVPPFGRHTLGDEDVEREAFKLQPGEVSTLIGTPQGNVVVKLIKRIPPDTTRKLEAEREQLTREVFEKKVQLEMQTAFRDMRKQANPKVMLKDAGKPFDLPGETRKLLAGSPDELKIDRKPAP